MEILSALLVLCKGNLWVNGGFPSQGQWCEAFVFSVKSAWTNLWKSSREAGELRYSFYIWHPCKAMYTIRTQILLLTQNVRTNNSSWNMTFHYCVWILNFELSNLFLSTNIMNLNMKFPNDLYCVRGQVTQINNVVIEIFQPGPLFTNMV